VDGGNEKIDNGYQNIEKMNLKYTCIETEKGAN